MQYFQYKQRLLSLAETDFAVFEQKLIFTQYPIIGVRTPLLRKIAKEWKGREEAYNRVLRKNKFLLKDRKVRFREG